MKKMLLLPAVLVLSTLLGTVSVSAKTTVVQRADRGANATWPDGTFVMVLAGNRETPMMMGRIFIVGMGPGEPPLWYIMKELTPSEFRWSLVACRVSTELNATHTLVIEWETVPPTELTHTNDPNYTGEIHLVHNGAMRWASATLMIVDALGNVVLTLEDGYGAVSRGARVEITVP